MKNGEVARILDEIGQLLEFKDENPFKIRAYHNGARAVESLTSDLATLVTEKKLTGIAGIGKALEEKITELLTTGKLAYYEELRKEIPEGLLAMLAIPSFGPKKARVVWKELGITTIEQLRKACEEDKL